MLVRMLTDVVGAGGVLSQGNVVEVDDAYGMILCAEPVDYPRAEPVAVTTVERRETRVAPVQAVVETVETIVPVQPGPVQPVGPVEPRAKPRRVVIEEDGPAPYAGQASVEPAPKRRGRPPKVA